MQRSLIYCTLGSALTSLLPPKIHNRQFDSTLTRFSRVELTMLSRRLRQHRRKMYFRKEFSSLEAAREKRKLSFDVRAVWVSSAFSSDRGKLKAWLFIWNIYAMERKHGLKETFETSIGLQPHRIRPNHDNILTWFEQESFRSRCEEFSSYHIFFVLEFMRFLLVARESSLRIRWKFLYKQEESCFSLFIRACSKLGSEINSQLLSWLDTNSQCRRFVSFFIAAAKFFHGSTPTSVGSTAIKSSFQCQV